MNSFFEYIIIGAGIAGIKAAEGIRMVDANGEIVIVNGEDRMPYKRTQLSKHLVKGFEKEAFMLYPQEWYEKNNIRIIHAKVKSVSLIHKNMTLFAAGQLQWGKLILATGSSPVPLMVKGNGKSEILYFRNAADAEALLDRTSGLQKVIVAGGGVLGVELAAAMNQLGKTVSLVHNDPFLMNRHFDEYQSDHLYQLMSSNGIQLLMHERVKSVSKTGSGKLLVEIGEMIQLLTDQLIAARGVYPAIELARQAGLDTQTGILVNQMLQTSHPDVYAAGDVAQHADKFVSGLWHDAENQGLIAGQNAAGRQIKRSARTYRLKLEVFGQFYFSFNKPAVLPSKDEIIRETNRMYHRFFFSNEKLVGALMLNDRERAKMLEKAVVEAWEKEKVMQCFTG